MCPRSRLTDVRSIRLCGVEQLKQLNVFLRDGILPLDSLRHRICDQVVEFVVWIVDDSQSCHRKTIGPLTWKSTPCRRYDVHFNCATKCEVELMPTANTTRRFSIGSIHMAKPSLLRIDTYDGLRVNISTDRLDGSCDRTSYLEY